MYNQMLLKVLKNTPLIVGEQFSTTFSANSLTEREEEIQDVYE